MVTNTIDVRDVAKKFGSNPVLKKISLQLPVGQIMGLIGPSGAGKTTLVKAILGMEKSMLERQRSWGRDALQSTAYYMAQATRSMRI